MTLLSVDTLCVAYGDFLAVRDVSFEVEEGAVFVLLGANGAGKTSVLRAISGLVPVRSGSINAQSGLLSGLRPHQVAHLGIAHVPEGRRVFVNLTVEDNLIVSFIARRSHQSRSEAIADVYAVFPRLAERKQQRAGTLSGGEQQMLAIGRALLNSPKLLMLDEPSLGLSPAMSDLVFERVAEIRDRGTTILLVEQNAACLELATAGLVLADGDVALAGGKETLMDSEFVRRAYLGI